MLKHKHCLCLLTHRANTRETQLASLQQQFRSAVESSSEALCALKEKLLAAELEAQEGSREMVRAPLAHLLV